MRSESFAQRRPPTLIDRLGVWLSARQIRRFVPSLVGLRVADIGCGYQASFVRPVLGEIERAVLVDLAVADDLKRHPRVQVIEGELPRCLAELPDGRLDLVLLMSVLEHLAEPLGVLEHAYRLLGPAGCCLVNVPSWRGKRYLELSAFRLGQSPACEMDDHKMYYDVRELWPLLVRAGFRPSGIRCFPHKLGLNTFAVCRREVAPA
jgi:SAM-dependent methyltransferase